MDVRPLALGVAAWAGAWAATSGEGRFVAAAVLTGRRAGADETAEDVDRVIEEAKAITDRPVVIEFVVHKDAMVWPMVAAGTSNDDIKIARDMAPDWEDENL